MLVWLLWTIPMFAADTLADVARRGDPAALRAMIERGVPVDARLPDGSTALHWATYHDDLEGVRLLLAGGASVTAATDLGVTALWNAAVNGNAAMIRMLLDAHATPNQALLSGETALMAAARSGSVDAVKLLLAKDANPNARGPRRQTALMWAVARKHTPVVAALLAHGVDLHAKSESWSMVMAVPPHGYLPYNRAIPHGGDTALLFAARVDDLESAKLLLAAGANIDDADAWGVTPLVLAAHSGYWELFEFLLSKGADPNLAGAGFSALHIAIMRREERMVAALLALGADPNIPLKTWTPTRRSSKDYHFVPALVGASPYWMAARFTHAGIMRLLAKHGADTRFAHTSETVTDIPGGGFGKKIETTTALMAALGMGGGGSAWIPARSERDALAIECAKLALELGVDVNQRNTDGRTALDMAAAIGNSDLIRLLEIIGAKPGKR